MFWFPNIYAGHVKALTPAVTDSSIDVRGEWAPNHDQETHVQRPGMVFNIFEDCGIVFVVVLLGRIGRVSIGNILCTIKNDLNNLQRPWKLLWL